jgi:hypothetical protein
MMEYDLMPLEFDDVVPLTQEIVKTKRELDDAEWEGKCYKHLQRHMAHLLEEQKEGELWYVLF